MPRRAEKFTFDVNYTWAHELDNMPNVLSGFTDPADLNRERAHGDTDVRHSFNVNVLRDLPSPHTRSPIVNQLFGGWSLSTIVQVRSGLTVNVLGPPTLGNPVRPEGVPGQPIRAPNYNPPDSQINPAAFTIKAGEFGTAQRNIARGPSFGQWNLGVLKNMQLTERVRLQFRAELFNVLNRPNFNHPNGTLCNGVTPTGECIPNALFGVSTSTVGNVISFGGGASRQVQFALRLLF